MQLRRCYSVLASSIMQTALVHVYFGNCAGAGSLFYLSTILCHFAHLLRRWRSFDWDTSIRWASRQEVATDSSQVKKHEDTIIVQFCGCWICMTYIKKVQNNGIIYPDLRLGDLSYWSLQQFACFPLTATLFYFDAAEFLRPSTYQATVWTSEELWFDPKQTQHIFQHSKLCSWKFSLT